MIAAGSAEIPKFEVRMSNRAFFPMNSPVGNSGLMPGSSPGVEEAAGPSILELPKSIKSWEFMPRKSSIAFQCRPDPLTSFDDVAF